MKEFIRKSKKELRFEIDRVSKNIHVVERKLEDYNKIFKKYNDELTRLYNELTNLAHEEPFDFSKDYTFQEACEFLIDNNKWEFMRVDDFRCLSISEGSILFIDETGAGISLNIHDIEEKWKRIL